MAKINFYAVGLGTLTDIVASIIFGVVIATILGETPVPLGVSMVIGLLCMTFGGFVTAKLSNEHKLYNATLVGILGILIGLPFLGMVPPWYAATSMLLMPPFAYLGGYIEAKI